MSATKQGWAVRGLAFTIIAAIAVVAFTVSGCTKPDVPAVREVTVIKEVPVPYHQPCPNAADVPVVPKRVAEEHPVMPKDPAQPDGVDWRGVSKILAAKVLELFGYADVADSELRACSKAR